MRGRPSSPVLPEPERVVAFFNRGRQVAGDLLEENERLRSRIRRLEAELRRAAASGTGGRDSGTETSGGA